ncbi:hypothetical protein BGZ73_004527 [Actinomortierella ambigua]|nr:hypothetical protein BGZ73_004527 [Actinomortierella ambigua]
MPAAVCGIHTLGDYHTRYLPLVDVNVRTTILALTSSTKLTQTFVNTSSVHLTEVRYVFPLYEGVSVVAFTCRIGNRTIVGEVNERTQARQYFNEAVTSGYRAGLLEQAREASDCFTTSVGNIPEGAKVEVEITYVCELKHDAEVDGIRLTIPAKIAPRYGKYPVSLMPMNAANTEGKMEITVDVVLPRQCSIQKIQSPSHPISVNLGTTSVAPNAEPVLSKASASLGLVHVGMEKDFVLQVVAKDIGVPTAVLETHPTIPNQRVVMATLVPRFSLPADYPEIVFMVDRSGSMRGRPIELVKSALKVFLKSIPVGVKFNIVSFGTYHAFLWLESKTYNEETLNEALRYVQTMEANLGNTEMYKPFKSIIEKRHRDLPLEILLLTDGEIWDQETLFNYLNKQVSEAKTPLRVFTLGVGSRVSHALIEGIAKAGHGFSQAVSDGEKMDTKLVRMLKGAMSPHISDYTLEVKYTSDAAMKVDVAHLTESNSEDGFELVERVQDCLKIDVDKNKSDETEGRLRIPKTPISLFDLSLDLDNNNGIQYMHHSKQRPPEVLPPKLMQAPHVIPPLFTFSRTTVYLLMGPECSRMKPTSIILRAESDYGPLELEIPIEFLEEHHGGMIHQLAARRAITELEQGRGWLKYAKDKTSDELVSLKYASCFGTMVEREAVRLGVLFQVGGKWTSFVAVEKIPTEDMAADAVAADEEQETKADDGTEKSEKEAEGEEKWSKEKEDQVAASDSLKSVAPPECRESINLSRRSHPESTPTQVPVAPPARDVVAPSLEPSRAEQVSSGGSDRLSGSSIATTRQVKPLVFKARSLSRMKSEEANEKTSVQKPEDESRLSPGLVETPGAIQQDSSPRVRSATSVSRKPFISSIRASISSVTTLMSLRSGNSNKMTTPTSPLSSPPDNMPAHNQPTFRVSPAMKPTLISPRHTPKTMSPRAPEQRGSRQDPLLEAVGSKPYPSYSNVLRNSAKRYSPRQHDPPIHSAPRPDSRDMIQSAQHFNLPPSAFPAGSSPESPNRMSSTYTQHSSDLKSPVLSSPPSSFDTPSLDAYADFDLLAVPNPQPSQVLSGSARSYGPPTPQSSRSPQAQSNSAAISGSDHALRRRPVDVHSVEYSPNRAPLAPGSGYDTAQGWSGYVPPAPSVFSTYQSAAPMAPATKSSTSGDTSHQYFSRPSAHFVPASSYSQPRTAGADYEDPTASTDNSSATYSNYTLSTINSSALKTSPQTSSPAAAGSETNSPSSPPWVARSVPMISKPIAGSDTYSAPSRPKTRPAPAEPRAPADSDTRPRTRPAPTRSSPAVTHGSAPPKSSSPIRVEEQDLFGSPLPRTRVVQPPFGEFALPNSSSSSSSPTTSHHHSPPPAPPPPPLLSTKPPLEVLIHLQAFAGFWKATPDLASCLGIAYSTLQEAHLHLDESTFLPSVEDSYTRYVGLTDESRAQMRRVELQLQLATALAIHYLEKHLANDKPTWELMVDKAREWLRGQVRGGGYAVVDALMAKAEALHAC